MRFIDFRTDVDENFSDVLRISQNMSENDEKSLSFWTSNEF